MTWKIGTFKKNQGWGDLSHPDVEVSGFVSDDGVFGVDPNCLNLAHVPTGMGIPHLRNLGEIDEYCNEISKRGIWNELGPMQLDPVTGTAKAEDPRFQQMKQAHAEVLALIRGTELQ